MFVCFHFFRLAPNHVSAHNNLGTLLENSEVDMYSLFKFVVKRIVII